MIDIIIVEFTIINLSDLSTYNAVIAIIVNSLIIIKLNHFPIAAMTLRGFIINFIIGYY